MRYALAVEYAGYAFCGFQSQPSRCGVQDALERAVGAIAGHPVGVVAAGRTDAGVHAVSQVVHFDTDVERPAHRVGARRQRAPAGRRGGAVGAAGRADDFHARFAASARHYTYLLLNRPERPGAARRPRGLVPSAARRRRDAARPRRTLLGTHDFSAFRAAECQAKSPVKTLHARRRRARRGRSCASTFPPTPSCITWCATSSVRWSTSARARQPPAWIADAARRARPHARGADVRGGRALSRRRGLRRALRAAADRARGHAGDRVSDDDARASRSAASRASPTGCAAARAGADAIGLVFWGGTPRVVDVGRAREIADALPPFVTKVGLFVDPAPADVRAVLDAVPLDVLQFHGTEPPRPVPRVRTAVPQGDPHEGRGRFGRIRSALRGRGGTAVRLVLAGRPAGRHRARVRLVAPVACRAGQAACAGHPVRRARPGQRRRRDPRRAAVGGRRVERRRGARRRTASRVAGIKDAARIAAFIEGVRNADD